MSLYWTIVQVVDIIVGQFEGNTTLTIRCCWTVQPYSSFYTLFQPGISKKNIQIVGTQYLVKYHKYATELATVIAKWFV